jgi:hypothetical protein
MRLAVCVVFAVSLLACASNPEPATPPAPQAVDPVGVFDFATNVEGTAVQGTITVESAPGGGHGGSITTDVTEPIPISGVTVDGQNMTVTAQTPDGPITMSLTFTGNDFTGSWTMGGMSGSLNGSRRSS